MPPYQHLTSTSSALLLAIAFIYWLLGGTSPPTNMGSGDQTFSYETVTGYFLQDDPKTVPEGFDYTANFGLIPRQYPASPSSQKEQTQWQLFTTHLHSLISSAPAGTTYKLFYLARHGQGDHNVAESFYGTKAWDEYWSKLDGNGTVSWSDAQLTPLGEQQARDAGKFFAHQFEKEKMPVPEAFFVSPLMRCLHTADLTFSNSTELGGSFRPTVKEMLREVMGEHTCDRRSSRSLIHKAYPSWPIEPGFSEADELWRADHRETFAEHDVRTQALLDDIFSNETKAAVVSTTSHSGAIASFLRVVGHREFRLPTGGLIAVLVRGRKV